MLTQIEQRNYSSILLTEFLSLVSKYSIQKVEDRLSRNV